MVKIRFSSACPSSMAYRIDGASADEPRERLDRAEKGIGEPSGRLAEVKVTVQGR